MTDLRTKRCVPCEGGVPPLDAEGIERLLASVPAWSLGEAGGVILRRFSFQDFHHTMEFVNAVAWIAHREDHHPDLVVSWGACEVRYTTHAAGGLTENDFICAAKVDALLE
ncbi:MAG: 4a-hydroxytetrahydrobiopterin dehydratase [Polyangiaceae bacterium]